MLIARIRASNTWEKMIHPCLMKKPGLGHEIVLKAVSIRSHNSLLVNWEKKLGENNKVPYSWVSVPHPCTNRELISPSNKRTLDWMCPIFCWVASSGFSSLLMRLTALSMVCRALVTEFFTGSNAMSFFATLSHWVHLSFSFDHSCLHLSIFSIVKSKLYICLFKPIFLF